VGGGDPALYGEFVLDPDARLGDVADVYGFTVAEADRAVTLRDFMRRELAGDLEQADRVSLGSVALIVRMVDEHHQIEEIGLAVLPAPIAAPRIPMFQSPREIAAGTRSLFGRLRRRKGIPVEGIGPTVPVDSGPPSDPGVGEHDQTSAPVAVEEPAPPQADEQPPAATGTGQEPEKAST
jgi:hypothetical protein